MLPPSVRVGPYVFTVAVVDQYDEEDPFGWTDWKRELIVVDRNLPAITRRDTLLHEVLHVVNWASGLQERLGVDEEELVTRQLSPWLLMLMRDNPELIKFLQGGDLVGS